MTQKGLVSLLLIAALLQVASCTVYPTWTYDGWEVIFLDRPSFLSSLHHSYHDELLYIFGQNSLRLVNSGRNFSAQDHPPAVEWNQPFISLHVFHNGSDLWAIGPTIPSDYTAYTEGYELPLAVTGPDMFQTQKVDGLQGYMLYNLFVDDRNHNDIVSYFVGYIPINGAENETVDQVAFGVVRVHLNLNAPFALRNFYFNYAVDVLPLTYNRYTIFGSHYKPFVHYQNQTNILIVVDPSNSNVHTIQVGPGTTPMAKLRTGLFTRAGTSISSSLFHSDTNLLFLGYAATGIGNGTVVAIDMSTFIIQHSITFSQELSNPRALAIDDNVDDTIYVGFNGGNAVVKLDYLLNVRGWQRVPPYMNHLEAARVGLDHVYLITNEQHSKVVRVNKTDFCPQQCPFYGYCKNGKCVCDINTQMSSDNTRCEFLTGGGMITDKGAAVALGVLFALTFIAAVLGWVLFWRARKSGYTAV